MDSEYIPLIHATNFQLDLHLDSLGGGGILLLSSLFLPKHELLQDVLGVVCTLVSGLFCNNESCNVTPFVLMSRQSRLRSQM